MTGRLYFIFSALVVCNLYTAYARPVGDKPNIVLIVADDLGYGELGCQGNSEIPTPHIDSIARSGIRFTQGYVTAAFCSASRAGLITGRYQTRFGYEFNPIGAQNEDPQAGLPVGQKTIADRLVDSGYITGIFGKWHLGGTAKFNPIRRGFDEFFGFLHEGHYFVPPPYEGSTTWMRRKVLMRWKGTLPAGGIYEKPVISLDICATSLALANSSPDSKKPGDGVNLIPFLKGENAGDPHQQLYWRIGSKAALRKGDWKILKNRENQWELYNLSDDISESTDLSVAQPERLSDLKSRWDSLNSEMMDPIWKPSK